MTSPPTREWQMPELPELPEPFDNIACINVAVTYPNDPVQEIPVYTADQMREYGRQCATKAPPMPEEVRETVALLERLRGCNEVAHAEDFSPLLDWLRAQGLVSAKE